MKAKLKTRKLLKSPTQLPSLWLATLLLSLSPLKAVASSFSSFIFFGDSITDPGNVFYALDGEITEPPFGGLVPPHFSQRVRAPTLKALSNMELNPNEAKRRKRQCVVRIPACIRIN